MVIGEPKREVFVEPLELPESIRTQPLEPEPDQEPVFVPSKDQPEQVPQRK